MDDIEYRLNSTLPNGLVDLDGLWAAIRPLSVDQIHVGVENICSNNPVTTVRLPELDVAFVFEPAAGWTVYGDDPVVRDAARVVENLATVLFVRRDDL